MDNELFFSLKLAGLVLKYQHDFTYRTPFLHWMMLHHDPGKRLNWKGKKIKFQQKLKTGGSHGRSRMFVEPGDIPLVL